MLVVEDDDDDESAVGSIVEYGLILLAKQTTRVMTRIEKMRKRAMEPGTK